MKFPKSLKGLAVAAAFMAPDKGTTSKSQEVTELQDSTHEAALDEAQTPEAKAEELWAQLEVEFPAAIARLRQTHPEWIAIVEEHNPELLENPKILKASMPLGSIFDIISDLGIGGIGLILLGIALLVAVGVGRSTKALAGGTVGALKYVAGVRPPEERGKVIDTNKLPSSFDIIGEITPDGHAAIAALSAPFKIRFENYRKAVKEVFQNLMYVDEDEGITTFKQAIQYKYLELRIADIDGQLTAGGAANQAALEMELGQLANQQANTLREILDNDLKITSIVRSGPSSMVATMKQKNMDAELIKQFAWAIHLPDNHPDFTSRLRRLKTLELKREFFKSAHAAAHQVLAGPVTNTPQDVAIRINAQAIVDFFEALENRINTIKKDRGPIYGIVDGIDGHKSLTTLTRRRVLKIGALSAIGVGTGMLVFGGGKDNAPEGAKDEDSKDIPVDPLPGFELPEIEPPTIKPEPIETEESEPDIIEPQPDTTPEEKPDTSEQADIQKPTKPKRENLWDKYNDIE